MMQCNIHRHEGAGLVMCSICMTSRQVIAVLHSVARSDTRSGTQGYQVSHFMCSNCYYSHSIGLTDDDVRCPICRNVRVVDTTQFICLPNATVDARNPDLYFDPQFNRFTFKVGRRWHEASVVSRASLDWRQVTPDDFRSQATVFQTQVDAFQDQVDAFQEQADIAAAAAASMENEEAAAAASMEDEEAAQEPRLASQAQQPRPDPETELTASLASLSILDAVRGAADTAGALRRSATNSLNQILLMQVASINALQKVIPQLDRSREKTLEELEADEALAMYVDQVRGMQGAGVPRVGIETASQIPNQVSLAVLATLAAASGGPRR